MDIGVVETNKRYKLMIETINKIKSNKSLMNKINNYEKKTNDLDPLELLRSEELGQYVANSEDYFLYKTYNFNVIKFKDILKCLKIELHAINYYKKTSFTLETLASASIYLNSGYMYYFKKSLWDTIQDYYFMLSIWFKYYNKIKHLL